MNVSVLAEHWLIRIHIVYSVYLHSEAKKKKKYEENKNKTWFGYITAINAFFSSTCTKNSICLLNILRSLVLVFFKRSYNRFVFLFVRPVSDVYIKHTRLFLIQKAPSIHMLAHRWSNNFSSTSLFSAIVAIFASCRSLFVCVCSRKRGKVDFNKKWNKQTAQFQIIVFFSTLIVCILIVFVFVICFFPILYSIHIIARLWRVVNEFAGFNIGHTRGTNIAR